MKFFYIKGPKVLFLIKGWVIEKGQTLLTNNQIKIQDPLITDENGKQIHSQ